MKRWLYEWSAVAAAFVAATAIKALPDRWERRIISRMDRRNRHA